jgi:hypothetical protein
MKLVLGTLDTMFFPWDYDGLHRDLRKIGDDITKV